jgi:predicted DsbA family dithiol-disulfide isomerase
MAFHFDVWSDFVCPWCFLVSTSLKKLQNSHGVTVAWKSYELRPKGSPPMPEAYKERIRAAYPQMVAMAQSQYGVTINSGQMGIDSRIAHIASKVADASGKGDDFHAKVFSAYWEQARDISDLNVLAEIAVDCGLDREHFLHELEQPHYEEQVTTDIETAYEYQLSGVPALIIQQKYYIPGAQPYDELVRIMEQLEQRLGTQS